MKLIKIVLSIFVLALLCSATQVNAQSNLYGKAAVTQITSGTTAVTMDAPSGVITTVSLTTAGAATTTFTLNNKAIEANSTIQVTVDGYSGTLGTNGIPYATTGTIAAGSVPINVSNVHASNALSGTVKLGVTVVN